MQKAVREAKVHTSWIHQDEQYGQAMRRFVHQTLSGRTATRFLGSFVPFARRIARIGAINALAQLMLKMTSPGVPDFYQGAEFWDLSLVDPDNRRPVDFAGRQRALDALTPLIDSAERGIDVSNEVSALLHAWPDARIKMLITACGLRFRREHASFMASSTYEPLSTSGRMAERLVAFARRGTEGTLIVAVPRLVAGMMAGEHWPSGPDAWDDTVVQCASSEVVRPFRHVVTGERIAPADTLRAADLLRQSPVAMLWSGAGTPEDARDHI
jgi:(1->4)-alpha-D-glucan 1-alpha-D-glucosylmutase